MSNIYYADLSIKYSDGAIGARRFTGYTTNQAMSEADEYLTGIIRAVRAVADYDVVSHKVVSGKLMEIVDGNPPF